MCERRTDGHLTHESPSSGEEASCELAPSPSPQEIGAALSLYDWSYLAFHGIGLITCIAASVGFLGYWWWLFDIAAHFRVYYFVLFFILTLLSFVFRLWLGAIVYGVGSIVHLALLLPFYWSPPAEPPPARTIRVLMANVNIGNPSAERALDYFRSCDPDILFVMEFNRYWANRVSTFTNRYVSSEITTQENPFGIAVWSRFPFVQSNIEIIGQVKAPSVFCQFDVDGLTVSLLATHPMPPVNSRLSYLRNQQLEAVGSFLNALPHPIILLGDINATPWSYPYRRLLHDTGLLDSMKGFGIQPTWRVGSLLFHLPIDHCFYSEEFQVIKRETGPDIGSDHLPLYLELGLRDQSVPSALIPKNQNTAND